MKSFVLATVLLLAAVGSQAQMPPVDIKPLSVQTEYRDVGSTLIQPDEAVPVARDILPEAPIPKSPTSPCPAGYWKPCAFLSGNLYGTDRYHITQHDRSWTKALSNPALIASTSLETVAVIMDYKTTRYCIDRHLAKEGNPLAGQSRAQELGVGIGALALSTFAAAELKSKGRGPQAIFAQWVGTVLHTYAAYHNAVTCGY